MEKIEQTNKVKILEELHKNGRATLSELAEKTGLSRQTVAKTIDSLEKNKQIWGYTTIFDPKLVGKKQFIFVGKIDLSINSEEFLKKATNPKFINDNAEKFGLKTSIFVNGTSDLFGIIWAKDIIEAKKFLNIYKKALQPNLKEVDLFDAMATFRFNSIANPKIADEWTNLLI